MNGQHPPFRNHDIIFLDTVNLQQIYSFVIIYTRTQQQRKEQEQEQQK